MNKPTIKLFREWLKQQKPFERNMYSVKGFYLYLGGKKPINKDGYSSKKFYLWLRDVWTPFFRKDITPILKEFGITSVMVGREGKPYNFIVDKNAVPLQATKDNA